ncbi:MAG: L,D-transpeptidase family protein [Candidatus Moraniibacteriota bacterium]
MLRRFANIFFWFLFLAFLGLLSGGVWFFVHERGKPISPGLETTELTGPHQPIVVHFSESVDPRSFTGKISLSPDTPFSLEWHDWDKELLLIPEKDWPLGQDYQLFIGQGKTSFFLKTGMSSFHVAGPRYPEIVEITPRNGATDVVLGVEDPLRVTLDRSARDFFLDFRVDPGAEVVYQNNPEKTAFEILPKGSLLPGKKYTLQIFAKWRNAPDAEYHFLGETLFATLPPVPVSLNGNLAARAEESKRFTRAKYAEGKYIDINLRSQVMTLFEEGKAVDAYIISSGKRGMETPTGEYAIENKSPRPWSKKYSLFMPYWQAIVPSGLFGIHELPEWPGGYKEGANHLGTPVSHGCVRLGVGPAARVYAWTEIGTRVVVY